jgi:hypothetical protein
MMLHIDVGVLNPLFYDKISMGIGQLGIEKYTSCL